MQTVDPSSDLGIELAPDARSEGFARGIRGVDRHRKRRSRVPSQLSQQGNVAPNGLSTACGVLCFRSI